MKTPERCGILILTAVIFSASVFSLSATGPDSPAGTGSSPAAGNAASVIQIWMWGGPSHLDTFDPKPEAGKDYTGPYAEPLQTNVPGIFIGRKFPLLAGMADKYSLIRSVTHGSNAHETAAYIMQTGREPGGGLVHPSLGAIVSRLRGYDAGYAGEIPPYVVIAESQGRFSEEGFLGPRYRPFITGGDPSRPVFEVEGLVSSGVGEKAIAERKKLLGSLDTMTRHRAADPAIRAFASAREAAFSMMTGDARRVFDLSLESEALRDRYGRTWFGQACLAARRLVEAGVPYITINYRGWDSHKDHFGFMDRKSVELDQGLSALLSDLELRGLRDKTIVWWGGEFGRTPRISWEAPWNGGRGHYGAVFSVLLAGGGFKGGTVVGASDARGETVADRPVHPRDLLGSILVRLGIDPDLPMPNPLGLDSAIMPASATGPGRGRLQEIMP